MNLNTKKYELSSPSIARGVEVVYTIDEFEAENWLRAHITDCSARAVGFDMEWEPQFISKKNGGTEHETAVLQLGVETSCLVLHIFHMGKLPKSLEMILCDENILKVGSGIRQDSLKLKRDRGLVLKGLADNQMIAKELDPAIRKTGMEALAGRYLGIKLDKGGWMSEWETFPLLTREIKYACLDAWVGFKIFQEMKRQKQQTKQERFNRPDLEESLLNIPRSNVIPTTKRHELFFPLNREVEVEVEVVYTTDVLEADKWLRAHLITDCSARAVGFDTEWEPQFINKRNGGTENKTAVIQLAVEDSCLVLHIHYMSRLPKLLKSILRDEEILKVGSGIRQDGFKLERDRGLVFKGLVDIQLIAKELDHTTEKPEMKALADRFLGIYLDQSGWVNEWEKFPLKVQEIKYAALDAWVRLKIFQEMKRQEQQTKEECLTTTEQYEGNVYNQTKNS